jgi:hypothetical protein
MCGILGLQRLIQPDILQRHKWHMRHTSDQHACILQQCECVRGHFVKLENFVHNRKSQSSSCYALLTPAEEEDLIEEDQEVLAYKKTRAGIEHTHSVEHRHTNSVEHRHTHSVEHMTKGSAVCV